MSFKSDNDTYLRYDKERDVRILLVGYSRTDPALYVEQQWVMNTPPLSLMASCSRDRYAGIRDM
jgi:hypothetical protein